MFIRENVESTCLFDVENTEMWKTQKATRKTILKITLMLTIRGKHCQYFGAYPACVHTQTSSILSFFPHTL